MSRRTFRTEVPVEKSKIQLGLDDQVLTIGSCFSDVIGGFLEQFKFNVLSNPFGTVYNPVSIFKLLAKSEIDQQLILQRDDLYLHHDFHSKLAAGSADELYQLIRRHQQQMEDFIRSCRLIIITVGTSVVYEHRSSDEIVANCHKVPQKNFNRRLLSVDEMHLAFDEFYEALRTLNNNADVLFTVSPVRHIKDGLQLNQVSKSLLRIFVHELVHQDDKIHYFPSYEVVMDELRDYRFYSRDMIHPSPEAEAYIWDLFRRAWLSDDTNQFIQDWQKILDAINHRAFNPNSDKHQLFIQNTLQNLRSFANITDISKEEQLLSQQLK